MSVRSMIFLLIILLLSIVSCREEKSAGPDGASEGGKDGPVLESGEASTSDEYDRPKRTLTFGTEAGADERTGTGKSEGIAAEAQSSTEGTEDQTSGSNSLRDMSRTRVFFEKIGDTAYYPTDLIIGQLVKEPETTEEERRVLDVLDRWMGSLGEESGDDRKGEFYSEGSGTILKRRFQNFNLTIDAVRFGRMEFKDGLVRLDVRFFSGQGRTTGEIVLKLSDGGWKIQAADVDVKALQQPYEPPEYETDPPVYGTMQM